MIPPAASTDFCPRSPDHRHVWGPGDIEDTGGWSYVVRCVCCEAKRAPEATAIFGATPTPP